MNPYHPSSSKPGLKRQRAVQTKKPEHYCSNCQCVRYTKCLCRLPKGKERRAA